MAAAARPDLGEMARYAVNGIAATAVHYAVLSLSLEALMVHSAGVASLVASAFGITVAFFGSRYFVFRQHKNTIARQAAGFALLYAAIACLHGLVLAVWTDLCRLDYRWGFLAATCLQLVLSYWGNRRLVFKPAR